MANRSTTVKKAVSAITSVRSELARAAVIGGAVAAIGGPPVGSGRDGGGNGYPPPLRLTNNDYIILPSSPILSRSAEISTTKPLPVFFHQCAVSCSSGVASPALWTMATEQVLAYSLTLLETT